VDRTFPHDAIHALKATVPVDSREHWCCIGGTLIGEQDDTITLD
jgi:hypothetical protein